MLAKWLVPKMKTVEMASVDNICWNPTPKEHGDESVDCTILENNDETFVTEDSLLLSLPVVDVQIEIDNFLQKLKSKGVSCPIMAMREPFSENYVPKNQENLVLDLTVDGPHYDLNVINLYLTSLFDSKYKSFPLEELHALAEDYELSYTQEQINFIEENTRGQSNCILWRRFRAGRITGSVFKAVCRTSLLTPSLSTVERICFHERCVFTSKATEYGKKNEAVALNSLFNEMSCEHVNYEIRTTGLIINNKYSFCGVSPDAISSCDCCGEGVVEIKCPYLMRFGDLRAYLKKKDCPLVIGKDTNSEYFLNREHEYYYQVQMQMFLTEVEHCDFVVWSNIKLIRIRVYKDEAFWNAKYEVASKFFRKVLLPELYSCYFSEKMKQKNKK